ASVCRAPSPPPAASAARTALTPNPATPVPVATQAPTPRLDALLPSASPSPDAVLTSTGPPTQPPKPTAAAPWLALRRMAIRLLTLGAGNRRRRGPRPASPARGARGR